MFRKKKNPDETGRKDSVLSIWQRARAIGYVFKPVVVLIAIVAILQAIVWVMPYLPEWIQIVGAVLFVIPALYAFGIMLFLILVLVTLLTHTIAPGFIAHDPNDEHWWQIWVKAKRNWTVVIEQAGRPLYTVEGTQSRPTYYFSHWLWNWYEWLIYTLFGYHPYLPIVTQPKTYPLPLQTTEKVEGVVTYHDEPHNRSNHVRTTTTDWPFLARQVYIGTLEFMVKLMVSYRTRTGDVRPLTATGKPSPTRPVTLNEVNGRPLRWEMETLYRVDAWNVHLNTVIETATRAVMVDEGVTLDMVIDSIGQELYPDRQVENSSGKKQDGDSRGKRLGYGYMGKQIHKYTKNWAGDSGEGSRADQVSLSRIGLIVEKVDVLAFEPALSDEAKQKLGAAAFALQDARGSYLQGQATAMALNALKEVFGDEAGEAIINSDALKNAAKDSEALTTFLTKFTQGLPQGPRS